MKESDKQMGRRRFLHRSAGVSMGALWLSGTAEQLQPIGPGVSKPGVFKPEGKPGEAYWDRLRGPHVSFSVGSVPMNNLARVIREQAGIYVIPMPVGGLNAVRVSTHFYNGTGQVDRLLRAGGQAPKVSGFFTERFDVTHEP